MRLHPECKFLARTLGRFDYCGFDFGFGCSDGGLYLLNPSPRLCQEFIRDKSQDFIQTIRTHGAEDVLISKACDKPLQFEIAIAFEFEAAAIRELNHVAFLTGVQ